MAKDLSIETPICTSVLVCDDVYQDRHTGKSILVGVFPRLALASLPGSRSFSVFFSLTNGRGGVDLRLRIEHDDGEPMLELGGPMNIPDPLAIIDHHVRLEGVPFRRAGKHWAAIYCEQELLGRRPFEVRDLNAEAAHR